MISGPGGSGKTQLLTRFTDFAVASDAMVLRATGTRMESNLSLGVVGQLLRSASLSTDTSERVDRLLNEGSSTVASVGAEMQILNHGHARIFRETCAILVELAKKHPVVIAVDDIQYADEPSLLALLYLQRRIASARIMLVATEWQPMPLMLHPLFLAEFTRQPTFRQIWLGSPSVKDTADLLRSTFVQDIAEATATAFHEASGGSPLLAQSLAADAARELTANPGAPVTPRLDGDNHRYAVVSSLHRWGPPLHPVARALAVLDDHATPTLIAELLGENLNTVQHALTALEATGIVVGERFRHGVYRQAVLEEMPGPVRSSLHLHAARLLDDHGASSLDVAGCLLDVANCLVTPVAPADPWAVQVLHTAAHHALAQSDLYHAAELLEAAHRVSPSEREQATLAAALSRVRSALNPRSVGRLLHPLTSACSTGQLSDRDMATLSGHLLGRGLSSEAAATLGWSTRIHQEADHMTAAELHLTAQWLRYTHPLVNTARSGRAEQGDDPARWITDPVNSTVHDDRRIHYAEQVLQNCVPGHTLIEAVQAAIAIHFYSGRAKHAAEWCRKLVKVARDQGAVEWAATLTAMRADMALRSGDLANADRYARQALTELPAEAWGVGVADPLATLLTALTAMGELGKAEPIAASIMPKGAKETTHWLKFLLARGRYHLAAHRYEVALGDLQTCGALVVSWRVDYPVLFPWRSTLAHVHTRLGQHEQARALLEAQTALPGSHEPWVRGRTLRALAAASEQGKRQVLLREAAELLNDSGDQLELALALADLSNAHDEQNESMKARLMAARAHKVATAVGADALMLRIPPRQILGLSTPEQPATDVSDAIPSQRSVPFTALSDAEQRVAALAASGYSNREIGRKLFITTSTVEQHLTRVYRKLSVKRRRELSLKLAPLLAESPLLV